MFRHHVIYFIRVIFILVLILLIHGSIQERQGFVFNALVEETEEPTPTQEEETEEAPGDEATGSVTETPVETEAPVVVTQAPPVESASESEPYPYVSVFDPSLSKRGYLPEGSLGLRGEQLIWEVIVTNDGNFPGTDIVILDDVRPEMRIDNVIVAEDEGVTYTINGQLVEVTIPFLDAANSTTFYIETTVLRSPDSGEFTNTAIIGDSGESASAQVPAYRLPTFFSPALSSPPSPTGPNPNISGIPDVNVFAGEQVCFDASFTNTGPPGYGPYIRIIIPPELIFDGASFIGTAQTPVFTGVFPASPGNVLTDPVSGDDVTGPEGYQFIVIRYPVGSVVTGNPPLDMNICLTPDPVTAEIGVDYPIEVVPGYEFGDTPTGENDSIVDVADPGKDGEITPILVLFDKTDNTPEGERPPGEDWTYQYNLTIELAPGQRLIDVIFTDALDADWRFTSFDGVSGTCTTAAQNVTTPTYATPDEGGGNLTVEFTEVNNPSATDTCTVIISYSGYILDILTETGSGDPDEEDIFNTATFDATWTGNDDNETLPQPQLSDDNTVLVENMVFQKGATPGDIIPGDAITYTIDFQITEFDAIAAATLTDIVPNGISVDYDSYEVVIGGTAYPIPNGSISRTNNADGTITVVFNIEDATGIPLPIPGSTGAFLRYDAVVDDFYRDASGNPDPNEPVRAADDMTNTVNGVFTLASGATQENDSSATVEVLPVSIEKETINPPDNGVGYAHGEDVTFRLSMEIPSGDTQGITFRDFFPLPVFDIDAADLGLELPGGSFSLPISNSSNLCFQRFDTGVNGSNCGIEFGPGSTIFPDVLSATINGAENSLTLEFDDVNTNSPQVLEILVTVAIIDRPFADGLFLSNQFETFVENTAGDIIPSDAISYVDLSAPRLTLIKGVVDSSNNDVVIDPPATGGVGANSDGDATGADAGDTITYAITVSNIGGAPAYDVVITEDVLSIAQLENCTLDSVTNGSGGAVAFTGGLSSIVITDPIPGNPNSATAGAAQQVVVRITCELTDGSGPDQQIVNTAAVDYKPLSTSDPAEAYPTVEDSATVETRGVEIEKVANPTNPTIGQIVTYTVTVDVPEGTINDATVTDFLPAGMAFVDCISVTSNGTLNTSIGTFSDACNDPTNPAVTNSGGTITWDFGTLSPVASSGNGQNEEIVLTYTAVVLDVGANVRGTNLTNVASFSATGVAPVSATSQVTVIEPELNVTKVADVTTVDAGDTINYTIEVQHTGISNATAYDLVVTDVIPDGLTFASFGAISPAPVSSSFDSVDTISLTFDSLAAGSSISIEYSVTVDADVEPTDDLINDVALSYDSRPEDDLVDVSPYTDPTDRERDYNDSIDETVSIAAPTINKDFDSSSETATSDPDVAIGERITYVVTAGIPQGIMSNVTITDTLDAGLAFIDITAASINYPPGVSSNRSTVDILNGANASAGNCNGGGCDVVFDFDTLTNSNSSNGVALSEITITYEVVVLDIGANVRGTQRNNNAVLSYDSGPDINAAAPEAIIVEPELILTKTANPNTGDAGDVISFTLRIEHSGNSDATAFDIDLEDVIPAGMTYVPASVAHTAGVAPDAGTLQENTGTISATWASLTTAQFSEIEYQVTLDNTVQPGNVITNVADITDYDTLVADDVLDGLSNYVNDGTDGERDYTASDDEDVTIVSPEVEKTIVNSSEADTINPDVAIGELVRYRVEVTIPEGVTDGISLTDTLDAGLAFMDLSDPTLASVTFPPSVSSTRTPAQILTDANTSVGNCNGGACDVVFNLGDLVNNDSNNATDEIIVIEYTVIVLDIASNTRGTNRNNSITATYPSGADVTDSAPDVVIVDPELEITKVANPASGDAGDEISYSITIAHIAASNAIAYDIQLEDVLPAGVTFDRFGTISGVAPTSGPAQTTGTITAFWDALAVGQSATIEVIVTIDNDTELNQIIDNVAQITNYNSLDDEDATGEDRSPYVNDDSDGERDRSDDDNAEILITGTGNITKIVDDTSHTGTDDGGDGEADLTIGEEVTYLLTVTLREGQSDNVVVQDALPAAGVSFVYVDSEIVSIGAGITVGSGTAGTPGTYSAASDTVTWNLGTVINPQGGGDTITFEIVVRVEDIADNTGIVTGQDTNLINTGTLTYDDVNGVLQSSNDPATVDLVEPELSLSKDRVTTPDPFDAGDTIQYRITLTHTANSTANAYDIEVTDTLPLTGMTFSQIDGGSCSVSSTDTTTAGQIVFSIDELLLSDASCDILYTLVIGNDAEVASTYTNTAVADYSTLPGTPDDDRNKTSNSDTADFQTPSPVIAKVVSGTSDAGNDDYAIGEVVTYRITVTLPEGTIDGVVVSDTPPSGAAILTPISMTVLGAGDGTDTAITGLVVGTDDTLAPLSINFGTLVNPPGGTNEIVLEVLARVTDDAANVGLVTNQDTGVTNTATLDYLDGNDVAQNDSDTAAIDIIEPELTVTKDNNPAGVPVADAGDTLSFIITVEHTGESLANAYDIELSDTLPLNGMTFAGVTGGTCVVAGTNFAAPVITFTIPTLALADTSCTIIYEVIVGNDAQPGSTYTNVVTGDYSTQPGTPDDDRTKALPSDDADFQTPGPQFNKNIISTSLADTGNGADADPDLTIGEIVTYELVATLTEGTINNVVITDTLPATFEVLSARVESIGANISGSALSAGDSGGVAGSTVTFTFGNLVNTPDATTGETDRIRVRIVARLSDDAANADGQTKTNDAEVSYTDNTGAVVSQGDTTDVDVVEPNLTLTKTFSETEVVRGTSLSMTLVIESDGTAPAYDILVNDLLNAGNPSTDADLSKIRIDSVLISSEPAGANTDVSTSVTGSYGSSEVNATIDRLLVGESVTLTVNITIDPASVPVPLTGVDALNNSATVDYDSLPGDDATDRDYNTDANDTLEIIVPTLIVTKVDDVDPVPAGDVVTYTITITNTGTPDIPANDVIMTDTLPVPSSGLSVQLVTPAQGSCSPVVAGVLTCNLGTIASGASTTVTVALRVNAGNVAQTMTNNVNVTSREGNDEDTDETTDIIRELDLAIEKVVSQSFPIEGDLISYTLTVDNNGPSNASNVVVTDTLPAGVTYVRFVPTTLPCSFGAGTLTCTFPSLAAGNTVEIGIEVTVDPGTGGNTIINTATVSANETETDNTNNSDDAPITVQTVDLALTKTVNPVTPAEGSIISYTLTVVNNGPGNATGVVVTDDLNAIAGISYISNNSNTTGTSYDSATGLWTIGDLDAGSSITLIIRARVDAGASAQAQPIINNATISAVDQTDSNPANNDDDAQITVNGLDLRLEKIVNNAFPQEGDTIIYTLRVTNLGAANATGVQVTDDFAGITGVSYISDNGGGNYNSGTGIWTVGNLRAGRSATLRITARVDSGAALEAQPIINNASITAVDQVDNNPNNNDDDANITVQTLDLSIVKTVDNSTPTRGEEITYTLVVTNAGIADATGVIVNDALDANLTFVSAIPNAAYDPATGNWTIGNLNATNSATLTITAIVNGTVPTGTTIPNVATITSVDQTDSDPGNNSDDENVVVDGLDLGVTKTVDDASPAEGDTITYTITVTNYGNADATGVVYSDVFPAGLSNFSFVASTGSYSTATNLWTIGALAASDSATLTVSATVDAGTSGTTIDNTVTLDSVDQADSNPDNNQDTASIIVDEVDLAVTKVVDNAGPSQGDVINYTITVTNNGDGNASGVIVTESIPADNVSLTLLSATPSQGSYTSNPPNSTWTVGNLANGASATLVLTVRVEANSGIIPNTVTVTGDQPDPNLDNNQDDAGIAIDGTDLAVDKSVDNPTPFANDIIVYTIVASNLGPGDATGAIVSDILPGGLAYISDDSAGSFNPVSGDWTIGNLASGASQTLNITAEVIDSSGVVTNTATISANEPDPNPGNNEDDAQIIIGGADLRLSKVRTVSGNRAGDIVVYILTVTNDGPNPTTGVVVTDRMPATLTYLSSTPSKGTVLASGNVVWTVGDLAIGESASLEIISQINGTPGSTTNVAEITSSDLPDPDSVPGNNRNGEDDQATSEGVLIGNPVPVVRDDDMPSEAVTLPEGIATDEGTNGINADGLTACNYDCVPFIFYHTNRTGDWEIFRLDTFADGQSGFDDSQHINLSQSEAYTDMAPSRSPDAEWIAYTSNRDGNWEIYVARTDGSEQRRVTHNQIATDTDPIWGPNNWIVYESTRDGNWELYLLDVLTGEEYRLTENEANDINASWAPSGDKLVFQSDRSGTWQLYEINLRSGIIRLLSDGTGNDFDPQYAPDGEKILFRSYRGDSSENSVLYLMDTEGKIITAVSDAGGNATNASWSPDADILAYQTDLNGDLDVYIYDVASGLSRQLTDNDVDDYAPTWLCNSSHIIFTSEIDGNPNIYQADALNLDAEPVDLTDETQAIQLTDDEANDIYPSGAPTEENASREGHLPDANNINFGTQKEFLPVTVQITEVDSSIDNLVDWIPINACSSDFCAARLESVSATERATLSEEMVGVRAIYNDLCLYDPDLVDD